MEKFPAVEAAQVRVNTTSKTRELSADVMLRDNATVPEAVAVAGYLYDVLDRSTTADSRLWLDLKNDTHAAKLRLSSGGLTREQFTDALSWGFGLPAALARSDEPDSLPGVRLELDASETPTSSAAGDSDRDEPSLVAMVDLGAGTDAEDLLEALSKVEQQARPGIAQVALRAADESFLGGAKGAPSDAELGLWQDLRTTRLPGTARVGLDARPTNGADAQVWVKIKVAGTEPELRGEVEELMKSQLSMLRDRYRRFTYDLTVNGSEVLSLDSQRCYAGGRRWGAARVVLWFHGEEACTR